MSLVALGRGALGATVALGAVVGATLGAAVGSTEALGAVVGAAVGASVGATEGAAVGATLALALGLALGLVPVLGVGPQATSMEMLAAAAKLVFRIFFCMSVKNLLKVYNLFCGIWAA